MTNNSQLEQQANELFNYTMDSLEYMNHKDLSTIILSMAKIAKTVKEAKQRRAKKDGY